MFGVNPTFLSKEKPDVPKETKIDKHNKKHNKMAIQKHLFWEALILAIFIFASGIFFGYLIESNRTSNIISAYQQSELSLLDIKIQENIFSSTEFDCDLAIKETIGFADRIYEEAQVLERYEGASTLSKGLMLQHKKYDLLRALLWLNTLKIKKNCDEDFHTIVYFYEYKSEDLDKKVEQNVFSKYLGQLKQEYGNKIILIPIAGNLDANSISFLMSDYEINNLPMILIDEDLKVGNMDDLESIREYLN